jgi:hypothetical protein
MKKILIQNLGKQYDHFLIFNSVIMICKIFSFKSIKYL